MKSCVGSAKWKHHEYSRNHKYDFDMIIIHLLKLIWMQIKLCPVGKLSEDTALKLTLVKRKGALKIRDKDYQKLRLLSSPWGTFLLLGKDLSNLMNHIDNLAGTIQEVNNVTIVMNNGKNDQCGNWWDPIRIELKLCGPGVEMMQWAK